jgi:hypothetical protein
VNTRGDDVVLRALQILHTPLYDELIGR